MIKLMIVDDEKIVCEGICNTLPWAEVGIEIIACAENGAAALPIAREKKPHIVLTDIRMPKMDGLEFIKLLHGEMPNIRIVIFSGYNDFAYAQQAIRFGVSDYLIKPIEADELLALMVRLRDEVERELSARVNKIALKEKTAQDLRRYISALLVGNHDEALSLLNGLLEDASVKRVSIRQQKDFCAEIVERTFLALRDNGLISSFQLQEEYRSRFAEMFHVISYEDLMQWLSRFISDIVDRIENENAGETHMAARKAMRYIAAHYTENLTVQSLAREVGLNANYFSHIFKKYCGKSFPDYLNALRVEKAKALLPDYRVGEVAEMVGFSDYKYFSSVFKKMEGVSPSIYLKKIN